MKMNMKLLFLNLLLLALYSSHCVANENDSSSPPNKNINSDFFLKNNEKEPLSDSFVQWKRIHDLKPEVDMRITKGNSFDMNLGDTLKLKRTNNQVNHDSKSHEDEISLSDMKRISLFTSDARFIIDHHQQQRDLLQPNIYEKTDQDWNILLFQDSVTEKTQRIFSSIYGETFVDMIKLDDTGGGGFVEILPDMIDKTRLNQEFSYSHDNGQDESFGGFRKNRKLRGRGLEEEEEEEETQLQDTSSSAASLPQEECTDYTPVEIAIAFDSTYCAEMGGTHEKALEDITQIMAQVQQMYKQPGICINLEVSHIEGFCDPAQDPYIDILSSGYSGCGSEHGALQGLASLWNNDESKTQDSVQRNFVHLFTGSPLECLGEYGTRCVIGCAFKDVICRPTYGYGLSYVTFSQNLILRAVLVAHEIGHNHGAEHMLLSSSSSSTGEKTSALLSGFSPFKYMSTKFKELIGVDCGSDFIMKLGVSDGKKGFSDESVTSIKSNIDAYISGTCE